MKILYHHRIASKDGQFVHIDSIITELKKMQHEIIMVEPAVAENNDFGSDGGWVSKIRAKVPKLLTEVLEFGYCFYDFLKMCKAIIKHKPDVIYERYNLFLPSGIWAKKLFRLPLILEVNAPLYDERNKYGGIAFPALAKWSESYAWRHADKVLPVTQVLADTVTSHGVKDDKIQVIPNGVNLSMFNPDQQAPRDDKYKDKVVIGFVGFCREWHRLDEVMRLLVKQNRDDLFFLLIGDGPVVPELKALAKELDFEHNFESTGLVKRADMPYWLAQFDIALQPDVTPYASPLKMIEYMVMGKAIVAPDTPNIRELLTDKQDALLFEQGNFDAFINSIEALCNQPELRQSLAQQATDQVLSRPLTWQHNAEIIVGLAESLQRQK